MSEPRRWVIGRGLLGNAVAAQLRDEPWHRRVRWDDPQTACEDLTTGISEFFSVVGDADWEIYWCAGKGVTSTPREILQREVDVFAQFLDDLTAHPHAALSRGTIFLGSSVGGIYGGSTATPFTESTDPAPASAYGEAKLAMEHLLRDAGSRTGLRSLIGRITNLYGPGQDLGKGQGLISVIISSYVTGRPTSIYVPLDTLRDYLYVDDCARIVVAGMERLRSAPRGTHVVKILASMRPLSIGAVLGEIARLRRVRAPIVSGQGNASGQALDLRVKSTIWTDLDALASTSLPAGLDAIYRSQLRQLMEPAER